MYLQIIFFESNKFFLIDKLLDDEDVKYINVYGLNINNSRIFVDKFYFERNEIDVSNLTDYIWNPNTLIKIRDYIRENKINKII